jgi:hypothetical protein
MEERIFSWSLDGFGSKLFRITVNGKEQFVNRYSAMDIYESDQEIRSSGEVVFGSFEEFWKEFTDHPLWLRYRPIFIHKDYKPFLQNFFHNIPQRSLTMGEKLRFILWLHKIE